ncbi:MAG: GWxTD domain-containing protein [Gemmatimonadetes bacterium]|nr:GWxTD domain-containing protein [Gemmatimonadota bacterium]
MSTARAILTFAAVGLATLPTGDSVSATAFRVHAGQPDPVVAVWQDPAEDAFERGQELIRAGDPETALILWVSLQDSLWAARAEDPRIGVAFVQTVVEHGLDDYREVATLIFERSFSGREVASDAARSEIMAEARRTFALIESVNADHLLRTGETDPTVLARAIKRFWIQRDPTPTTPLNERLFEHWERIVHARRNYIYNYSSPFRTDDRGTFYVRYGEPDRITAGTLTVSAFDLQYRGVAIQDIMTVDLNPRYEIWRYANIEPPAFTYFLFGNVDQTGPFEYVEGLSEIIGPTARMARINGIRAQYYLELFYYIELGKMGGPYGARLDELDRLWGEARQPPAGVLEARSVQHAVEDTREAQRFKAPSHSRFDDSRKSVLSAQVARTLVGQDPRLLVLAVSSPLWRPEVGRELRDGVSLAPFSAAHTVLARDGNLDEVARAAMVELDIEGNVSMLVMRHASRIGHLTVAAEHMVRGQDLEDAEDVGVLPGHAHFAVARPLRRDAVQFEVSDLIVGIAPESLVGVDSLPLPLLPASRFWRADPVRVYLEIYHPTGVTDGETGNYDLRVLLVPFTGTATPEELARSDAGGRAAIEINIESQAPTGRHYFDLDLRNERPGPLQLVVEVTDRSTGVSRARATPIALLPN